LFSLLSTLTCSENDEKNRSRHLFLAIVIVIKATTTTGTTSYRIYFLESSNSPSQQQQQEPQQQRQYKSPSFRVFNFVGVTVKCNNMVHEGCDPIKKLKPDQSDIRFVWEGRGFIIMSNIIYASQLF
jgi:hypothetical protein